MVHLPAKSEPPRPLDERWPAGPMDELAAMLEKERCDDYRAAGSDRYVGPDGEARIEGMWRHRVCEWYHEVVDQYGFDREIAAIALSCFDRYVRRTHLDEPVPGDAFQMAAITALYLAIKVHCAGDDRTARRRSRALEGLRRGHRLEVRDVERMELHMLEALGWRLSPPTMHQFALRFSVLHPQGAVCPRSSGYLHDAACYQAELAVFLPHLLEGFEPSVLAYAAVLNASDMFDRGELSHEVREEWLSLMTHPAVKMDESRVWEAQEALLELCPVLPSVDDFETLRQNSTALSPAKSGIGAASPSTVSDV